MLNMRLNMVVVEVTVNCNYSKLTVGIHTHLYPIKL